MKAIRVHEYGRQATLDQVEEPKVVSPADVVVEVQAAGVCRTDLHIIEGQWADKTGVELPHILGHENAGTVREVGQAVSSVVPGDTVILHPLVTCGLCRPCRAGDDVHCQNSAFPGVDSSGGMAELLRTNARAVVKLDSTLRPQDVAALADAGLTAYHASHKAAEHLFPGSHVVCIGAGGLGHIGIQCMLAMSTAELTVVDASEQALEHARGLGAHHTVLADGGQLDQVLEITGGNGAEVVMDYVGENGTEALSTAMTRDAGYHFVIGYGGRVDVPTIDIISREINIIGNLVGSYNDLVELMSLTAQGKVSLRTQTFGLDDGIEALAELDHGRIPGGRAILVP